jgi:hypothetical protein
MLRRYGLPAGSLRAYTKKAAPVQPSHKLARQLNAKILHPPQNLIPETTAEKYNIRPKSAFTKHNQPLLYLPLDILNASFIKKRQFLTLDNFFSKA